MQLALVSANHRGWFEFRLCPNDNIQAPVTQTCFNRFLLTSPDGITSRFPVEAYGTGDVTLLLRLPIGLTCAQCVLQWKYNAGNNWGVDPSTGQGCLGCGPQEQFYACADIAITPKSFQRHYNNLLQSPLFNHVFRQTKQNFLQSVSLQHYHENPTMIMSRNKNSFSMCRSAGAWTGRAEMTSWCQRNCVPGYCPETHCICA